MAKNEKERLESDALGEFALPADSLGGISGRRALENFGHVGGTVHPALLRAYGIVKLACVRANQEHGFIERDKADALARACDELCRDKLPLPFELAALQGAAGTSTNMFVNELLANRSLEILGREPGSYDIISPFDHVNLHQSTNDTYPTALRIAAIFSCDTLAENVAKLTDAFQQKEREFADIVKLGRTQLQDAVLITLGREMGAYAEAFSRDRWRLSKCRERLRVVNLGATAVGTAIAASREYVFSVVKELRNITSLPLARAENLVSATQNHDEIVEVSGLLKTLATNLFKISSDLRLLSSGPVGGIGEIKLPPRQPGSSIMPAKVNPVIAEMAAQVALQALGRDTVISTCAMNGQLELNPLLPCIAHNLLCMLDELNLAVVQMCELLVKDIQADARRCRQFVDSSTAVITAFVHKLGYEKCSQIVTQAAAENRTVREVLLERGICDLDEYNRLTSSRAVLALGYRRGENAENT